MSRFPSSDIDLALVVRDEVSAERVAEALGAPAGDLLESVKLFDVYRGGNVPEGSRQPRLPVALLLVRSHPDR